MMFGYAVFHHKGCEGDKASLFADNISVMARGRSPRSHPEMVKPGTISGWLRLRLAMTSGGISKFPGTRLLLFCALMAFAPAAYADCTLAGTAVCNGVACPGKTFKAGQIIHNADHGVLQVCLADDTWKALHKAVVPSGCTTSTIPGTPCADGQTVYAGSWNGSRYYTTMTDQSTTAYWGAYGVIFGSDAQSDTDGLMNTNTVLAYLEANPQAGACNVSPYNPPACTPNAHLLCKNLRTILGGDWYLPAKDEFINVLYANNAAIGGLTSIGYWSSSAAPASNFAHMILSNGNTNIATRNTFVITGVRCVRR